MYINHAFLFLTTTTTLLTISLVLLPSGVNADEHHDEYGHYINEYAIEINGDGLVADLVAGTHNLKLKNHLDRLGNIYHYVHDDTPQRSKRSADSFLEKLRRDPNVVFVDQQQILHRVKRPAISHHRQKREMIYDKQIEIDSPLSNSEAILNYYFGTGNKRGGQQCTQSENVKRGQMEFNDPDFCLQWYLRNTGEVEGPAGNDAGVVDVWKKYGLTGKGVTVSVLDDGLDHTHPDLRDNYDPEASMDANSDDDDPMPNIEGAAKMANAHGTRCAGEIAAAANNGVCGVGVAYEANIGGVRMLDGRVTDSLEARALNFNYDKIDIYSASWGPRDNGETMEAPNRLATKALEEGAKKGRRGLGSIFSWATGNGGEKDDCDCDGYVSSIYTISIGCINAMAFSTYFSEICPSTMAVIFTGGSHDPPGEAGYSHPQLSIITTDLGGGCNLDFEGTSSAAPFAAGIFALVLQANPNLTWRDLQHVIALTAFIPNADEDGWFINAAGYHVNPKFGFGALHALKMVEVVYNNSWITVPEHKQCDVAQSNSAMDIIKGGKISQTITTDGCQSSDPQNAVESLEHTQIHVKIKTGCRGSLSIKIISAGQTQSEILSLRPADNFNDEFEWTFMTVHNWGENPSGTWELVIDDNGKYSHEPGTLLEWSLTFFGFVGQNPNRLDSSREMPSNNNNINTNNNNQQQAYEADQSEIQNIMADEQAERKEASVVDKEESDNNSIKTEEEKHAELKDLSNLARIVLNDEDYKVIKEYLFKDSKDKGAGAGGEEEERVVELGDDYWQRVYNRELKEKFNGNLNDEELYSEKKGYNNYDGSKVNLGNTNNNYDVNIDNNDFILSEKENNNNVNVNNIGNYGPYKTNIDNDIEIKNSKKEKTENDIKESIALIEKIMARMEKEKYE